jgi:glycosyltransferase involved in cell wall biosynthesis
MRILLAADQYPEFHNGAGAATERLAAGFAGRGHRVTVAYPSADGPGSRRCRGTVDDHRLASVALPHGQGVRVCLPSRASREAADLITGTGFDVVHVHSHLPVGRAVLAAAQRTGLPVVATNHFMPENLLPHIPVPDPVRHRLAAWAWRDLARVFGRADLVTTPTVRAAELLADRTGLRAIPVSNGVDLSAYAPHTDTDPDGSPIVLFVGRLEDEKRVQDLLRAFAAVPLPNPARLVYVGTGSRLPMLRQLADTLGVADRVEFWGNVSTERLRRAYTACAVFCAPGIAELQSLVTLEAIASGAPVIAADAVALPHLVHHGRNGYTYPPDQPRQLTSHLTNLLTSPAVRHRMSLESRRIARIHDIETTLDAYLCCYQELCRDTRRGDLVASDRVTAA